MKNEIDRETFDHLVQLAALDLDPEEAEYLRGELNNQLNAIHELEAIPIGEDIPVTSHGVPYTPEITPAIRDDTWIAYPHPEDIFEQAPEREDGYIAVPDIPHEELE